MKTIRMSIVLLLFLPAVVSAQTSSDGVPVVEVFGGYSYLRTDLTFDPRFFQLFNLDKNMIGWNASATVNVNRWLGVEADFSGHYGSKFNEFGFLQMPRENLIQHHHTFLFGPKVTFRNNSKVAPFTHVLFGVAKAQATVTALDVFGGVTDKGFAAAAGGGIDIRIGNQIGVRVAQLDYLHTRMFDEPDGNLAITQAPQHNIRFSAGIVFEFGRR